MKPLEIGVCSWSLKAANLAEAPRVCKEELGLNLIQLGFFDDASLEPAALEALAEAVQATGVEVSATCVGHPGEDYSSIEAIAKTGGYVPDDQWQERFERTVRVRDFTATIGARMLTTHVGFVPHDPAEPRYQVMLDRLRAVADSLAEKSITLTMETGQEPVDVLKRFIADIDRPNVKVNFDPGNVILYGIGSPVEAAEALGDHIAHVHCKDATLSDQPGVAWGTEVPLGTGQAELPKVISKLRAIGYTGPLVIEREAGQDPIGDIRKGIEFLNNLLA